MAAQQQQVAQPGQYFDVPGIGGGTQWSEQDETTVSLLTTLASGNQVPVNGISQFKQTDVVLDWLVEIDFTQTFTAGGATFVDSDYAPWNMIGPVSLPIQNQYKSVDVASGIDLYIFNLIRPFEKTDQTNQAYAPIGDFAGSTPLGYAFANNAQPNLVNAAQWAHTAAGWNAILRLPASQTFDIYYDLALTGEPVAAPHAAIVSPQYMAGSARVITPLVTLNALTGNADVAPVNSSGGGPTIAGTATMTFRRKINYAANPALEPPVYGWQYRWHTTNFQLNGVSVRDIQIPQETGQLLMAYVRMFDPAANGGIGAPISLANVTRVQLQFGSGLLRFDGTPRQLQHLFLKQHGFLLPKGVLCFDLALDQNGNLTNRRALNLLTTSGVLVHLTFSSATSSTAYAVLGTESLVFVA